MKNFLSGYKTKIGCTVILGGAVTHHYFPAWGVEIFMVGVAIAFYGVHFRVRRVKKAMLRG